MTRSYKRELRVYIEQRKNAFPNNFPDNSENNEDLGSGEGCFPIDDEDCVGETTNPPNIKSTTEATNNIIDNNNAKGSSYSESATNFFVTSSKR